MLLLQKLSGEMEELMQRILALKQQDNAVSPSLVGSHVIPSHVQIYRKIFDLVFANYTAYVQVR